MSALNKTEITKAIEAHRKGECHNCPYEGLPRCFDILCENAVKFINRLTKENELLHATREDHFIRAQANAISAMKERLDIEVSVVLEPRCRLEHLAVPAYKIDQITREMLEDINNESKST